MFQDTFSSAGHTAHVLWRSLRWMVRKPRWRMTARLMYENGFKSLSVVAVVAFFSGMIIALQSGIQLAKFGQMDLLPPLVAQTFCREFGPFVTCIILVGTVVSAFAAEIGTMTVSEETAALEVMSIDPVGYLAAPRILALTVMAFFLIVFADVVGVIGGALIAHTQFDMAYGRFFDLALTSLKGRDWFVPKDVYAGLIKGTFTAYVIAGVGCTAGLRAHGGALGVGRAVRSAVIASILLILILSYDFTWLTYRAFI